MESKFYTLHTHTHSLSLTLSPSPPFLSLFSLPPIAFILMVALAIVRIAEGCHNLPKLAKLNGFPPLFGVSIYSFMCQHSLPGMVTPMKDKRHIYWMLAGDFLLVLSFYFLLIFTGVFAFSTDHMSQLYTLDFFVPGQEIIKLVLGVYLALFPVFTLSTSFPIISVTLRENIKALAKLIFRREEFPFVVDRIVFPLVTIIPPIALAYATQQDDLLVSITGSFPGLAVQYLIPTTLVLTARYKFKTVFGKYRNRYSSPVGHVIITGVVIAWAGISTILVIVKMALSPPQLIDHPLQ